MLEVIIWHKSFDFLKHLHLARITQVTRLSLQNFLHNCLFIFEYIGDHIRILIVLFQKVTQNSLRAQLQALLTLLKYYFDYFLQQCFTILFRLLKSWKNLMLCRQNLEHSLNETMLKQLGILMECKVILYNICLLVLFLTNFTIKVLQLFILLLVWLITLFIVINDELEALYQYWSV